MSEHEVHPLDQLKARLDEAGTPYTTMTLKPRSNDIQQIDKMSPKVKRLLDMTSAGQMPELQDLYVVFSELWAYLNSWRRSFELLMGEGEIPIDYLRGASALFSAIRTVDAVAFLRALRTQRLVIGNYTDTNTDGRSWFKEGLEKARIDPADVMLEELGVPAGYLLLCIELYEAARDNDAATMQKKSPEFNKALMEAKRGNHG